MNNGPGRKGICSQLNQDLWKHIEEDLLKKNPLA